MTSKNRYFFAQYNEDPLRHDEIVVGIGRSVGLKKRVKTLGNVLTKSTRIAQKYRIFLENNPIPVKSPPIITSIKITNDNRKLIKIKFNKKINTPTNVIDKNDFKVTIDGEVKSIKKIENINGDLFIILNNFIYDHNNISVEYTKDLVNLIDNIYHHDTRIDNYDWEYARATPPDNSLSNVEDFDVSANNLTDTTPPIFTTIKLQEENKIKITADDEIVNNNVQPENFIIKLDDTVQDISAVDFSNNEILITLKNNISPGESINFNYINNLIVYYLDINKEIIDLSYNNIHNLFNSNITDASGNLVENIYDHSIVNYLVSKPLKAVYDTVYDRFTIHFDSALSSLKDLSGIDFRIERYSNDFEIYNEIDDVISLDVDDTKLILNTKDGISNNVRVSYDPSGIPLSRRLVNRQNIEIEKFELSIYEPLHFTSFLLIDTNTIILTTNIEYLHTNIGKDNLIIKMGNVIQDISSIAFNSKQIEITMTNPIVAGESVNITYLNNMVIYYVDLNHDKVDLSYNSQYELLNSNISDLSGNRILNVFEETIVNHLITKPINARYDHYYNRITIFFDSNVKVNTDISGDDFIIEQYDSVNETYNSVDKITNIEFDNTELKLFLRDGISNNIRIRYDPSNIPIENRLTNNLNVEIEDFILNIYEPIEFKSFDLVDATTIKIITNNTIINNNIQTSNFIINVNDQVKTISNMDISENVITLTLENPVISSDIITFTYTSNFVIYYVELNHDRVDLSYNTADEIINNNLADQSGSIVENIFDVSITNNLPTTIQMVTYENQQLKLRFTGDLQETDVSLNDFIILRKVTNLDTIQPGDKLLTLAYNDDVTQGLFVEITDKRVDTYAGNHTELNIYFKIYRYNINGHRPPYTAVVHYPFDNFKDNFDPFYRIVNTVTDITFSGKNVLLNLSTNNIENTSLRYLVRNSNGVYFETPLRALNNNPIENFAMPILYPTNIIVSRAEVLRDEPNKIRIYFRIDDLIEEPNVLQSITDIKVQKGIFDINISSNVPLDPGDFTVTNNGVTQKITSASISSVETKILFYNFTNNPGSNDFATYENNYINVNDTNGINSIVLEVEDLASTNYEDIKISYTFNSVEIRDNSGSLIPNIVNQKLTNVIKKGEIFYAATTNIMLGRYLYNDVSILFPQNELSMTDASYNEFLNTYSNSVALHFQNIYYELGSIDFPIDTKILITDTDSGGLNVFSKEDFWRFPFNIKLI